MNGIDRLVAWGVVVLLACVTLRTILEAATFLLMPGLIVAGAYAFFRAWKIGVFAFLKLKVVEKKEGA